MPQLIKELAVKELQEQFSRVHQTGCVVVNYHGVKANEARELRQKVRQMGGRMTVVKNSLFAIAMRNLQVEQIESLLEGPVAVVQAEDPVAAAKAVREITEACDRLQVRGAYVDGQVVGPERVQKLASIPGRDELLAMVAGALMAPLRRLAFALLAKQRALLSALDQLSKRKAEQEAGGGKSAG